MTAASGIVRTPLVLLAIATLAASCAGQEESEPPGDVAYQASVSGGDDAAVDGRLVVTDGCLRLEVDGRSMVPIFPDRGIVWYGDVLKVGGQAFPLDVDLTLGGGGYEGAPPEGVTIPPGCTDAEAFWFVNLD